MRMIFHLPLPLNPKATSASGIRPVRMLAAFRELGLDVTVVAGHSSERREAIKAVLKDLRSGGRYDFVYSESSTMPTAMTDPHHLPLHPLMDFRLLRAVRRSGGKVGLFYRDIYWMFPEYATMVPFAQRTAAVANYRWDLHQYRSALDVMYLPSLPMASYVGDVPYSFKALPPAHSIDQPDEVPSSPLRLFYVGGLGVHYKLHALVAAMREVPEAHLTLCTREKEWQSEGPSYQPLPPNVEVVHKVGDAELAPFYATSNLGVLSTRPEGYFAFAVPYKLYEYIGHGLPILATRNTMTGDTVAKNGFGWTLDHDPAVIASHLRSLVDHPEQLQSARESVVAARDANTWAHRAAQVVADLTT
ncbi:MAG TPA: glycosyltransferase [Arachnia sp.]|nr:glycosyltransferase [Arachnia sp.]